MTFLSYILLTLDSLPHSRPLFLHYCSVHSALLTITPKKHTVLSLEEKIEHLEKFECGECMAQHCVENWVMNQNVSNIRESNENLRSSVIKATPAIEKFLSSHR